MDSNRFDLNPIAAALVGSVALLAACGGGGGSDTPAPPATVNVTTSVIDGAIQGATVCLDKNDNGACDADEPSGKTGADGSVTLSVLEADAGKYPLLAIVGTDAVDKDNGPVAAAYVMKAPADKTGVISPLTTLVQQVVESSKVSSTDAEKVVKDQTGISVSLFADYTKTRDADSASAAAGLVARTMVVTAQQQTQALASAVGEPDGSGDTISKADLDKAVSDAMAAVLPQLIVAANDSGVQSACAGAAITSAACQSAVQTQAAALLAQTGLSATTLPVLVGVSKQLSSAATDPNAAPTEGASLDFANFGDANNWSYRIFVSTAAENTPDANGLTRYREVRRQLVGGVLTEWAFNGDPARKGDVHWNGSAWVDCPFGHQNTQTVRGAEGRNTNNYCDSYEKSNGQRVDVDISGKPMSDVVATIRTFPSTARAYPLWGTPPGGFSGTSTFTVGTDTFPAGSKLRYQTTTPTEEAFAYDVRASAVAFLYSAALAAGGDARSNPTSACNSAEFNAAPTNNAGTLEKLIATARGTPCIFNAGSFTVGSTTYTNPNNPSSVWSNSSTLSIGTLGSVSISSTPTAYFTGNTLIRLAFTGSGTNPVTYYACQQQFRNGAVRECSVIGTGSYTITTLGDGRVMTLSNPPAQAAALTYNRVFVERGGKVYFGYLSKLVPTKQIRLNLPAANAIFAKAGVPAVTP